MFTLVSIPVFINNRCNYMFLWVPIYFYWFEVKLPEQIVISLTYRCCKLGRQIRKFIEVSCLKLCSSFIKHKIRT